MKILSTTHQGTATKKYKQKKRKEKKTQKKEN